MLNHDHWLRFPLLLLVGLILLLGPNVPGFSQPDGSVSASRTESGAPAQVQNASGSAQEIMAGFYLLNGGKLDFQNSSVPLDFYLWLNFTGTQTPKIEFTNSRNAVIVEETNDSFSIASGPFQRTVSYRVSGMFEQDLDMKKYPFTEYVIRIAMEETEKDITERIFLPDTSGTNLDDNFQIIGWNILHRELESVAHRYKTNFGQTTKEEETYSRVELKLHIGRDHQVIFLKIYTPVLLFLAIALLGLVFPIEQLNQKISLSVAALFSSVAYHINLSTGLPPVGYLTFIDKMMIGQYGILFMNVLFTVSVFAFSRADWKIAELRLLWISRVLVPLLAFGVFLYLFHDVNL